MRSALVATLFLVITTTGCSDDPSTYDQRAEAAEQLAIAIAGSDIGIAAMPRPSSCVPPSSCPDAAVVELPDRTALTIEQLADVARELGWAAIDDGGRLITIENLGEGWSGSISLSGDGRVGVAVGEG